MSEDDSLTGFTAECPVCDGSLEGEYGAVPTATTTTQEVVRVDLECPSCGSALVLVAESAAPDALGLDLRVERKTPS